VKECEKFVSRGMVEGGRRERRAQHSEKLAGSVSHKRMFLGELHEGR
jgi:hypothetical protein